MRALAAYFRGRSGRPYVRPWALATPIAVLLVCLPLLRPLRHPGQLSTDEELRLATISSLVEHSGGNIDASLPARLALDTTRFPIHSHTIRTNDLVYSDQPPMLAFLLAGPYWVMHYWGYGIRTAPLADYSVLVPYLLTLLGVTLPAAAVGGLIYRMGRIFELPRPWRAALAATVVFGSGLISYAVVLNAHVPAAALVLAAAGCLIHLAASKQPSRGGGWLALAGFCAALATTIDLSAVIFLVLLAIVIATMRLSVGLRFGGLILYALGALPPILLHAALVVPVTGNLLPGSLHPELALHRSARSVDLPEIPADESTSAQVPTASDVSDVEDTSGSSGFWGSLWHGVGQIAWSLLGEHGVLVHFPIVILGFVGMLAVMHRHWPTTTKVLAADSALAAVLALGAFALLHSGAESAAEAGFANRWLIVFLPILLFWGGAWLRRPHHPGVWSAAGILLFFSVVASLIGATDPMPRGGYMRYTIIGAVHNLMHPHSSEGAMIVVNR